MANRLACNHAGVSDLMDSHAGRLFCLHDLCRTPIHSIIPRPFAIIHPAVPKMTKDSPIYSQTKGPADATNLCTLAPKSPLSI